jgi:hypothetical protein
MNLLTTTLPDTIIVDGREYAIYTDFRDWIRFCEMMLDEELTKVEKAYISMMLFKEQPTDIAKAVKALTNFYLMANFEEEQEELVEEVEEEHAEEIEVTPKPIYDWTVDSAYIIGAFQKTYGIDLMNIEYMHWWRFKALFTSIIEFDLEERIGYRALDTSKIKDKDERKRLDRIKKSLMLKTSVTDEEIGGVFGG